MNCALLQKGSREENLWKCGWPKRVGWEVNVKNAKTKNVAQGFSEMWNLQHILKECRCYDQCSRSRENGSESCFFQ